MSVLNYIDSDIFTPVFGNNLPRIKSERIDTIIRELYYEIKTGAPIFIYGDYDMDGLCCMQVWKAVLSALYGTPPVLFRYSLRMHELDADIVRQVEQSTCRTVIICDTGSGEADKRVLNQLRARGVLPLVIDHHAYSGDYFEDAKSSFIFNSHEEREILGGSKVSGAYASLLVALRLCEDYFHVPLPPVAAVYALASMYSDVVDLSTPIGRALYNFVKISNPKFPRLYSELCTWGVYSRRLFSFIISPKINACFRSEEFGPLNDALSAVSAHSIRDVAKRLKEVHSTSSRTVTTVTPLFDRYDYNGITLYVCNADADVQSSMHARNFSGLIATRLSREVKGAVVVLLRDSQGYSGSFRDYMDRSMLSSFQLFCKAGGHNSAFGVSCTDIEDFKRHLPFVANTMHTQLLKCCTTVSSSLVENKEDVEALALYNEYMNTRPKAMILHRLPYARMLSSTKWTRVYEVGLPYVVKSNTPLYEGDSLLLEPAIQKGVVLLYEGGCT